MTNRNKRTTINPTLRLLGIIAFIMGTGGCDHDFTISDKNSKEPIGAHVGEHILSMPMELYAQKQQEVDRLTAENQSLKEQLRQARVANPSAVVQVRLRQNYSRVAGGTTGNEFAPLILPPGGKWISIQAWIDGPGGKILAVSFKYSDENGSTQVRRIGGLDGIPSEEFQVPAMARMTQISGTCGHYIDGIRFHFSDGSQTPIYGKQSSDRTFALPENQGTVVGVFGRQGGGIDQLGVWIEQ